MLYFINIGKLENLYIDKILFEFENIPIVFICKHDEVSVYEGFKNSNESIYLINQKDNHFLYNKYLFSDLPKSELPEDKIYL